MCIRMWLHYPLIWRLGSYKVCLCFIVLSVTVCIVGYICLFRGDQIFVGFVTFLSMIIYEVLYAWCLRYNICSAWFLDIRISTCIYTTIIKYPIELLIIWYPGPLLQSHWLKWKICRRCNGKASFWEIEWSCLIRLFS